MGIKNVLLELSALGKKTPFYSPPRNLTVGNELQENPAGRTGRPGRTTSGQPDQSGPAVRRTRVQDRAEPGRGRTSPGHFVRAGRTFRATRTTPGSTASRRRGSPGSKRHNPDGSRTSLGYLVRAGRTFRASRTTPASAKAPAQKQHRNTKTEIS